MRTQNLGLSRAQMAEVFKVEMDSKLQGLDKRREEEIDTKLSAAFSAILSVMEANNKQILEDLRHLDILTEQN